jgi:cystathionine gamma-synthase
MSEKHIETIAVHAGSSNFTLSKDVTPALHLSTTFSRNEDGTTNEFMYSRNSNPNREMLQQKLAALEQCEFALAFASGLAAVNAILQNVLEPNSHIILPTDCYHGTKQLIQQNFTNWGVSHSLANMQDLNAVEAAIQTNTALIWIETPSNPKLDITDIEQIVKLAKQKNIKVVCDNTFATPLLQKPLQLGVDIVMHSSTKYFGGHSDILGGVVCFNNNNTFAPKLLAYQKTAGAVPSPFDCWLLHRSLSTFPLRFTAQCSNAMKIASFLQTQPNVEAVYYPGLTTHANHLVAKKQMQLGFGAMVTILVKGGQKQAMQLANNLQLFKHATSLGGVESLIEHRRSVEGENAISPDNLLRLSIGIEHAKDLIDDLEKGLAALTD